MKNRFFGAISMLGFFLVLAASVIAVIFGKAEILTGIWVGAAWVFLNTFFLFEMIEMAMTADKARLKSVRWLLVLKFPVLYVTGFFILRTGAFSIAGILIGLTLFFVSGVIGWMRFNFNRKVLTVAILCFLIAPIAAASAESLTDTHAVDAAHAEASHHEADEHHESGLHTTNLIGFVSRFLPAEAAKFLAGAENVIFGILVIFILSLLFYAASKNMTLIPGRLQAFCETIVEGLNNFVCGIIGPEGRQYTPFLGTLFLYILTMNLIGLVPLMKSNTANAITLQGPVALPIPTTTVSLALIVFVTVQAIGIRKQGLLGYLDHMAGTPRDVFGWVMAPLMFPIHLIGELAKPFSLTFRLFCNIMGGHILVAVFIGMGVAAFMIPFQAPFLLFEIATSTIQAFVFTLLSTVYIAMMMPHGDHEGHDPAHEHASH